MGCTLIGFVLNPYVLLSTNSISNFTTQKKKKKKKPILIIKTKNKITIEITYFVFSCSALCMTIETTIEHG